MFISSRRIKGVPVRRIAVKACLGRGRKRPSWKLLLHDLLISEFERLRALQLKATRIILRDAALALIDDHDFPHNVQEVVARSLSIQRCPLLKKK